jgi:GST-like protein
MFGQLNHFSIYGADAPYALERYRGIAKRLYGILDERLSASAYLAGADYSIADIATFHWAGYLEQHKLNWADFPHLARWRDAIAARPAAQREAKNMPRLIDAPENGYASASKTDMDRFFWRA